jgi:hypothetical protein
MSSSLASDPSLHPLPSQVVNGITSTDVNPSTEQIEALQAELAELELHPHTLERARKTDEDPLTIQESTEKQKESGNDEAKLVKNTTRECM